MAGGRPCSICVHASRSAIEQAILNGKHKTAIARDFGFTYVRSADQKVMGDHKAIQRHIDQCMPDAYARAVAEREVESGVAMAARLRYLDEQVDLVIEQAKQGTPVVVGDAPLLADDGKPILRYDFRLLLAAVKEGRGNMELLAKLAGKTEDAPEDLEQVRKHLDSPEARKLLAELDKLAADADANPTPRAGE